jgi:hypothetical protein
MGPFGHMRLMGAAGAVLMAAGLFTPARAQDPDDLKRAVARISLMNGEVSVRRGDSADWVAGVINAPLLADDRISTGPNSRAEVQFDAVNALRIGGNAEVRVAQLEYGRYQMEVARGTVTYRVLRASDVNVELDTPNISVRPSQMGTFRISVSETGETEVTARAGNVEIFTPRGSQWVNAGQTLIARGSQSDPEFQVVAAIGIDDWDRWNDSRDRPLTQSPSAQYVPQGVYGTEELDQNGTWENVEEYGNVWHPRAVAADWAPYSSGRWVWQDWYGWTWVSYDPWGWAPYHYGRWFHNDRIGWCWYPGARGVRQYWSPALVGWFGFGGGGGIGFGFGRVGWVPLAPFERFNPWWGRSFRNGGYLNQSVNITNVNVTNVYRNSRVRNGISGVAYGDFQHGRFNSVGHFSGDQVRQAGVFNGRMPIAPGNDNRRFTDRQAFVPRTNENIRFFQHQQTTPSQRTPVGQPQRGVEAGRVAVGGNQAGAVQNGLRGQQGQINVSPRGAESGGSDRGGWRRFGEPGAQAAQRPRQGEASRGDQNSFRGGQNPALQNTRPQSAPSNDRAPAQPQNRSGWGNFGDPRGRSQTTTPRQDFAPQQQRQPNGGGYNGSSRQQESIRVAPPVVRERQSAPSNSAPHGGGNYSAPRQQSGGGGGNYSAPRQQSGGSGGNQQRSGGGGQRDSGGGNHGGGNGGGGRRR